MRNDAALVNVGMSAVVERCGRAASPRQQVVDPGYASLLLTMVHHFIRLSRMR